MDLPSYPLSRIKIHLLAPAPNPTLTAPTLAPSTATTNPSPAPPLLTDESPPLPPYMCCLLSLPLPRPPQPPFFLISSEPLLPPIALLPHLRWLLPPDPPLPPKHSLLIAPANLHHPTPSSDPRSVFLDTSEPKP